MTRVPEIFIVCPGVGHIGRGYETFTRQCFDALKNDGSFRLRMFKGAGENGNLEVQVPIFPRTGFLARLAGKLSRRNGYDIEQLSFALGLIPYLRKHKPEVVYFSDRELGAMLWRWRRLSKQSFKLLFSNGGPAPPPFPRWDHVHQVSPEHYMSALHAGVPEAQQTLIPYGYTIDRNPRILNADEKNDLRRRLGLPAGRQIVLSVGMLSAVHKRMDYVIEEVGSLPEPRPFLVMLGQSVGAETLKMRAKAENRLGQGQYFMASVPPSRVQDYYRSADAFVLASLSEGLPRVLVEALAAGLPCIAHDYQTTRYVLGESGFLTDLRPSGALSRKILQAFQETNHLNARLARQADAYERFSWDRLAPQYAAMLHRIARGDVASQGRQTEPETTPNNYFDTRNIPPAIDSQQVGLKR